MGMFVVILSQNDVGKLLLMLSCANRKFDNLMLSANFKILRLLYKGLTDDPLVESPDFMKYRCWVKNIFLKNVSNIYRKYLSTGPPPDLCIMLYTCSYIFFLMAACKMISFDEQHKNLSLRKIFYLHCICIFH